MEVFQHLASLVEENPHVDVQVWQGPSYPNSENAHMARIVLEELFLTHSQGTSSSCNPKLNAKPEP